MGSISDIHLYTIWNPNLDGDTLGCHEKVCAKERRVKWIILYDRETDFENTITSIDIERINADVSHRPIYLFIQCLNIFYKPFTVGKIEKVEVLENFVLPPSDKLIPRYYYEQAAERDLKAHYAITLSDLKSIPLGEITDIKPAEDFRSGKFNFPYPCIVYLTNQKDYFDEVQDSKFYIVEIVYENHIDLKKKCWFMKKPSPIKDVRVPTFGKKEIELLRLLVGKDKITAVKIRSLTKKMGNDTNYIYNIKSRINRKCKKAFSKNLISKKSSAYILNADKVVISTG
jgi:hypothetical protein